MRQRKPIRRGHLPFEALGREHIRTAFLSNSRVRDRVAGLGDGASVTETADRLEG